MPPSVYIPGAFTTEFRKWPGKSFKELTREAFTGALMDAQLADGTGIDTVWFANSGMGAWGQHSVRGQVCVAPLLREGLFQKHIPIYNVENACAGGSTAIHLAWSDIRSGNSDMALAIGVEKLCFPGVAKDKVAEGFSAGTDSLDPEEGLADYRALAAEMGEKFIVPPGRSPFIEAAALRARWYLAQGRLTARQIAEACSRSHWYGARNPKAQYQFEVPTEAVLRDRVVADPLTRAMCAVPGDGAAAVLLCSEAALHRMAPSVRARSIELASSATSGGCFRKMGEPGATASAARKAFEIAGIGRGEIQLAEVHDSTSFCQIEQAESLGLPETTRINTSGGLVSKSHPVAATGVSMLCELAAQLRGEAGERQVGGARIGLLQNSGGMVGLDDAISCVMVLRSPDGPDRPTRIY